MASSSSKRCVPFHVCARRIGSLHTQSGGTALVWMCSDRFLSPIQSDHLRPSSPADRARAICGALA
eukprot:1668063-Prymnesium_polylepis.2